MSAAAFGKAIGPIAKKIGGEVAEGLSKTADDWGWKGGKKGEITGGEFIRRRNEIDSKIRDNENRYMVSAPSERPKLDSIYDELKMKRTDLYSEFLEQQKMDVRYLGLPQVLERRAWEFASLEDADIPRRFTGKLREAIVKNDPGAAVMGFPRIGNNHVRIQDLSKIMEEMTESQRETFVTLMPGWADTFEKLIEVSRSL